MSSLRQEILLHALVDVTRTIRAIERNATSAVTKSKVAELKKIKDQIRTKLIGE